MYIRHLRRRLFDRLRHSAHILSWLASQATRLGIRSIDVFNLLLKGNSAEQVEATAGVAPINLTAPSISGTPSSGQVLTADKGTWNGTGAITYAYQWQANDVDLAGATASTYTVQAGDSGKSVTVEVTASNSTGSTSASSVGVTIA